MLTTCSVLLTTSKQNRNKTGIFSGLKECGEKATSYVMLLIILMAFNVLGGVKKSVNSDVLQHIFFSI